MTGSLRLQEVWLSDCVASGLTPHVAAAIAGLVLSETMLECLISSSVLCCQAC